MILSILATVAVLAAIVVMLSALVFAESVLVYIALGLGATSVLLMIGALVQQRSGTTGPEPEFSGTDGLGKLSVPVTQARALATGATAVGSMPDTDESEDSRRVPAPANGPVRDASVPGTGTVEEDIDHGEPEYEVPRWKTPTQGDWPDPVRTHVPAPEESPEEETPPAPAAPAGASAFDDEEVSFPSSVRTAEAERGESDHLSWSYDPVASTDPGSEPDEDQTSAPEPVEPEEAPATARTPDTDDGGPDHEDGTDETAAGTLESAGADAPEPAVDLADEDSESAEEPAAVEDEEPEQEPAEAQETESGDEPDIELSETEEDADPGLASDPVDEDSADETISIEDESPVESVTSSDEDREPETDEEADTETLAEVEAEAVEDTEDETGSALESEEEPDVEAPVEEPAGEPVPADEADGEDTVEEPEVDLGSEVEQGALEGGAVSAVTGGEDPSDDVLEEGGDPAPDADADQPEAEQDEDVETADTDDERVSEEADKTREDDAGEHAVAYAVIVDTDHDSAGREAAPVGAEDPGSSR